MVEIVRLIVGLVETVVLVVDHRAVQGRLRDFTVLVTLETAVDVRMARFGVRFGDRGVARRVVRRLSNMPPVETAHVRRGERRWLLLLLLLRG